MTMVKHFVAHKKLGTEGQFKVLKLGCTAMLPSAPTSHPPLLSPSQSCDRTPVSGPRLSLTFHALHSPPTIAKVTLFKGFNMSSILDIEYNIERDKPS